MDSKVRSTPLLTVYPAIDIKSGQCVRLVQGRFDKVTTYSTDPLQIARRWRDEGAGWLHVVDLDGARLGVPDARNLEIVREIIADIRLPIQYGGGVRSLQSAELLTGIGISRIVAGTAVARDAALAVELFKRFGERIAVGVDSRDGVVAVDGWQQSTLEPAERFVARMAELGARRFIFTDIARDGMLIGINTVALAQVAAAVPMLPVIASGGVTSLGDIDSLKKLRSTTSPNIEGVIIGKALYTAAVSLPDVLLRAAAAQ